MKLTTHFHLQPREMRGVVPPLPHMSSCPAAYSSIGENSYTVIGGRVVHPPTEIRDAINMSVAISTLQRVMSADNRILIPCQGTIRHRNDGFKTRTYLAWLCILLGSVSPISKCSTLQAAMSVTRTFVNKIWLNWIISRRISTVFFT